MSDVIAGAAFALVALAVIAFSCWVLWTEQTARRVQAHRDECNRATLAHVLGLDVTTDDAIGGQS